MKESGGRKQGAISPCAELPIYQRGDAVSSMVYEANARMKDPIYGCVGTIFYLQHQIELAIAQAELVHMKMQQFSSTSAGGGTAVLPRQIQSNTLRSRFVVSLNGFRVSSVAVRRVGFVRKTFECKESRIGKQPVPIPSNVTLTMNGQDLKVKGPLGEMAITYPREVKLEKEDGGILRVRKSVETRRANQMHGLFRTLTDNMVVGVSKGFEKKLQLVGVGYLRMEIPAGLQVKVEENTRITVSGYDKSAIGQFAASIRKWRPPEPYKGKGVKYADEVVRRKEGKAGKKK
ncbi:unnamed protein product [Withania somnifera]